MSALARIHQLPHRRPRAASHSITVAQFNALMAAIKELPDRIADELEMRGNVPSRCDINPPMAPLHCDDDFFL